MMMVIEKNLSYSANKNICVDKCLAPKGLRALFVDFWLLGTAFENLLLCECYNGMVLSIKNFPVLCCRKLLSWH
jgi:hypothetical protein